MKHRLSWRQWRFMAQVSPPRAILEAYGLAAIAMLILLSLRDELPRVNIDQGWFFTSAGVAVWTALRLRLPQGHWYRRALIEIGTGILASAAVWRPHPQHHL